MLQSGLSYLKGLSGPSRTYVRAGILLACVAYKLWPYMSAKHSVLRNVTRKELAEPVHSDLFPQYMRNPEGLYLYIRRWLPTTITTTLPPSSSSSPTPAPGPTPRPIPRAVVFLVHGFAEHSSRYEHLARVLNGAGISLYALDHQGHGLSDGDRAHVEHFDAYIRDYALFVAQVQKEIDADIAANVANGHVSPSSQIGAASGVSGDASASGARATAESLRPPCFLLGHSMGGLIATRLAIYQRQSATPASPPAFPSVVRSGDKAEAEAAAAAAAVWPWAGLMLSGPALELDPSLKNPVLLAAGRALSWLLPKLPVQALDPSGISTLPVVRLRYERDPLVYRGAARARFGMEFLEAIKKAIAGAPALRGLPVFIQHGSDDKICPPSGSTALVAALSTAATGSATAAAAAAAAASESKSAEAGEAAAPCAELRLIPGGRHEILADQGWQDVAKAYLHWVFERS